MAKRKPAIVEHLPQSTATSRPKATVFISHSHEDNELVRDLARRLRDAGLNPLVDFADLTSGGGLRGPVWMDWKKKVPDQIRAADAVLMLVTPAALKSAWMMRELGMAEGLERVVLPLTAGVKPRDLPAPLQSYQVTPFDEADRAINTLSESLTPAAKE